MLTAGMDFEKAPTSVKIKVLSGFQPGETEHRTQLSHAKAPES